MSFGLSVRLSVVRGEQRLPPATERLVKLYQVRGDCPFALRKLVLEGEQRTLRLQDGGEINQPRLVLVLRQLSRPMGRFLPLTKWSILQIR